LEELKNERLKKLEKIRALGIDPFPSTFEERQPISSALKLGKTVKVAGRIMGWRGHGALSFADLIDESGQIQVLFKRDSLPANLLELSQLLDVGDFVGLTGKTFKTKSGELTVEVADFKLLTKSLVPIPAKSGLTDTEERYRKRYLDLILNPDVKERFDRISQIVQNMRKFLIKEGYAEVLTPSLQPLYGGTLARPFETHFNALDADFYLRISNEMYLKRLIAGGYEKIFEFSVDFRNEGIDTTHNPEFLQMETMWAYVDYKENMKLSEEMFSFIAKEVLGKTKFTYQEKTVDFKTPWKRMRLVEAVEKETGKSWEKVKTLSDAKDFAKSAGVNAAEKHLMGEILEEIFDQKVKSKIVNPTLIYDYPRDVSPLAKVVPGNPSYTERFEIFIAGQEYGNSYSEANDPLLLRENFSQQTKLRESGGLESHPVDEEFLAAMEQGMPPTSGLGVGMDRLFMLLTDTPSIRDVMFFPALRPKK